MNENKKLNIGIFSEVYYPMIDGVLKVLENHVKHLGHLANFHLIVTGAPKGFKEVSIGETTLYRTKSIKVFFLDYRVPLPKLDRKLNKHLKSLNLDAVVSHSPFGIGKAGLKFAKKNNIPSIIYAHSQIKQDFYRATKSKILTSIMLRAKMKVYRKATEVVAVGEGIRKVYEQEYKLKRNTIVINNAADLKFLDNKDYIKSIKDKYGINSQFIFSFLGRINKLKGIYLIADSLKLVKDAGVDFKMIYIGDGGDLKAYEKHIEELGLTDNVIFVGKIKDRNEIAAYLNMSDLFLFPSMYDASSLVQQEAASQKTPVLFAEGSTTSYGLTEGVHCFFAKYDKNDYANKIIQLVNNPKQLKDIRESVYNNLYQTWEESSLELYNLILKLIEDFKTNKLD